MGFCRWMVVGVLVALVAGGCVSKGASGGSAKEMVVYSRSGGFAVLQDSLVVRDDGALSLMQKGGVVKSGSAPAEEIRKLRGLIDSAAFAAAPASSTSKGADQITYTIKASTKNGEKTVVTMDGAERPQILDDVMNELQGLMERCR